MLVGLGWVERLADGVQITSPSSFNLEIATSNEQFTQRIRRSKQEVRMLRVVQLRRNSFHVVEARANLQKPACSSNAQSFGELSIHLQKYERCDLVALDPLPARPVPT